MTTTAIATKTVKTTCPYCGVGCGVAVDIDHQGQVNISGDREHPANFGRLCSKGSALGDTVGEAGRLLQPQINGEIVSWPRALDAVADAFRNTIDRYGPDSVAFYVSGQLLTEDYYVANKLMKGFIGSGNIDTNSRLCMSSAVAGYKRAFGSDTVPCDYSDLEAADLIVLVGSNTAWCHPIIYQRIVQAQQTRNSRIVVIDPRRTPTCEIADLHLPIKPGTDTVLFNGLLLYLQQHNAIDSAYVQNYTQGFNKAMAAAQNSAESLEQIASICELNVEQLQRFYQMFAATEKTLTLYSMGVNQSSSGTDKANSIINCHLATGRLGKPGMGPFSITGQPNAMGGREVGGLANTLAAHMEFNNPEQWQLVKDFWQAEHMASQPGLLAVDLFNAIERGEVKAVWIMATNPVVSLPDADRVRAALQACDHVIVSDCYQNTDTLACANIALPAAGWGEKDGTVTNSERRISRQRAFRPCAGAARPDWWIITQVARRLGFAEAFPYESAADIFREHASLSGYNNLGSRDFDISALAEISDTEYNNLSPVQWPLSANTVNTKKLFADGRFYTDNGKARLVPIQFRPPGHLPDADYPFILNSGRVRDHWHTMTRTANSARLSTHRPEPFVQLHPDDAQAQAIADGELVMLESRWGKMLARVALTTEVRRGNVFAPMHWNEQFAKSARVDAVINPVVDPISGEPEFKHTPVRISPYRPQWYGFVLSRTALDERHSDYWVQVKHKACWRYELAGEPPAADWSDFFQRMFQHNGDADWLEYDDKARGRYRAALLDDRQQIQACVFVSSDYALPERAWLASLFEQDEIAQDARLSLLAGRPADASQDIGRIVCSCFAVGINTLKTAISQQKLTTTAAIGDALQAGTNCGSCIPELKALLKSCER